MKYNIRLKQIIFLLISAVMFLPNPAMSDENLALYGLKGYGYTYSPLTPGGLHVQTGVMYSLFDDKLECREGDIWVAPFSLSFGDGKWWELSAATHWEYWENKTK